MFSGKTTELLRRVEIEESIGRDVIVINHLHDGSRSGDGFVETHSGKSRKCIMLNSLSQLKDLYPELFTSSSGMKVIAINEGQFFNDLESVVMELVEHHGHNVIVCGLDSDSSREPFMEIVRLIPHSNHSMRTTARCHSCKDGTEAHYTFRKTKQTERVQVGGSDLYIPVCRKCYHLLQSTSS
jgi:thymidine kinase